MSEAEGIASVRTKVADAGRVLEYCGLGDLVWGHVSMRDPLGRGAWLKQSGLGFVEVTADEVHLVSPTGDVVAGHGCRHVEYAIHTEVYRARPDVGAVVHAHPEAALAFAATGQMLRPLSHDGCLLVPPDVARFGDTADLVSTPAIGASLARTLADRNAALLPHHGIVTVGATIDEAVMVAVLLERACRIQLLAGEPRTWSSDEEALAKRASCWPVAQLIAAYAHLRRVALDG